MKLLMTAAGLLTFSAVMLVGGRYFPEDYAIFRGVAVVGGTAVAVAYMRSRAMERR